MKSRREFLRSVTALGLGGLALTLERLPLFGADGDRNTAEFLLIADATLPAKMPDLNYDSQEETRTFSTPGELKIWRIGSPEATSIALPFKGHAVISHPLRPQIVAVAEKWGPNAVLADVRDHSVLKRIPARPDHRFFGHSCFSADGRRLYLSQVDDLSKKGLIGVYDALTGEERGMFRSYGGYPHEIRLTNQGKALLVVNAGYHGHAPGHSSKEEDYYLHGSSLAWIHPESGELLKLTRLPDQNANYTHFNHSADGWIFVHGLDFLPPHNGDGLLISPSGVLSPVALPAPKVPEILSSAFLEEKGLLAFTCPNQNRVYFLDYKENKILHSTSLEKPQGIGLDSKRAKFLISAARTRRIFSVRADSAAHESEVFNQKSRLGGSGSHLTLVTLPA